MEGVAFIKITLRIMRIFLNGNPCLFIKENSKRVKVF